MKYDILESFKGYVYEHTDSENTAKKYYGSVKKLLESIQFNDLKEIPMDKLIEKLVAINGKDNFSATKRGLMLLKQYDSSLQLPPEEFFLETSSHKRNHRKKSDAINIDSIKRKINQMSDKKLKLAYRLGLISGLRVSELEALEPGDLSFSDGIITIQVRKGKGNRAREVHSMQDEYVYAELQEFISNMQLNEKIFYSEEKMRKDAGELGMECHDFRRIYAYISKKDLKKGGASNYQANRVLQSNLGHSRYKTTRRYLYGKKFIG